MLAIVVQENIKLGDNTPEWWAEKNASQCWTKKQVLWVYMQLYMWQESLV